MHTEFVLSTDLNLIIWFQVSDSMESIKFYKACLAEHSFIRFTSVLAGVSTRRVWDRNSCCSGFCLFVFLGKHFQVKEIEENRIGQEKQKTKTEPEYGSDSTGNRGGQIVQPSHFVLMGVSQGSGLPLGGVGVIASQVRLLLFV